MHCLSRIYIYIYTHTHTVVKLNSVQHCVWFLNFIAQFHKGTHSTRIMTTIYTSLSHNMILPKIRLPHFNSLHISCCFYQIQRLPEYNNCGSWRNRTLGSLVRNPYGSVHDVSASFSAYSTEAHKRGPINFVCTSVFLHVTMREPLTPIIIKSDTNQNH